MIGEVLGDGGRSNGECGVTVTLRNARGPAPVYPTLVQFEGTAKQNLRIRIRPYRPGNGGRRELDWETTICVRCGYGSPMTEMGVFLKLPVIVEVDTLAEYPPEPKPEPQPHFPPVEGVVPVANR